MKKHIRNDTTLKLTGSVLVIVGMITLFISTGLMIAAFQHSQAEASLASEFAGEIQQSLIPSTLGMPLFLVGIGMLVLAWFRGRRRKRMTFLSND